MIDEGEEPHRPRRENRTHGARRIDNQVMTVELSDIGDIAKALRGF